MLSTALDQLYITAITELYCTVTVLKLIYKMLYLSLNPKEIVNANKQTTFRYSQ